MQYLQTYLDKIIERGNTDLAESIKKTASEVGEKYIQKFSFTSHEIGLLLGNVQSGKTGQMFGIMCKATDLGFPVFILLTTDNVVLQQQTLDRVKADLEGFCICGENDAVLFTENSLMLPTIIVLKKNAKVLKLWANIINSTGFMKGNPLFIVDDEADAASLNTQINRNVKSSINKYLDSIKTATASSIYLQVTGTPQALLLQTIASGWRPYFTYYFKPGKGYLGGDFFFPSTNERSDSIEFIDKLSDPILEMVIRHIAVSAQILEAGGKVSNALVHPSVRQAVHEKYAKDIIEKLSWCKEKLDGDFEKKIIQIYQDLNPQKMTKVGQKEYVIRAKNLLINDEIRILIMNGRNEVDSNDYSFGSNIIIGGNTLGRGVTFAGLHTIFYSRSSKKPQADTMWQHSRMFGYDRDPGMMRVYIDNRLYKLFADINATNNSIIAQVEKGSKDIKIYYPSNINPTRKNVLDNKHVDCITGGSNYYPSSPDNKSIDEITALLNTFSDEEPFYQVSLRLVLTLFEHIIPSDDFNQSAFVAVIEAILAEKPAGQGVLIVRRNRDVAQGTGALLSPNDWNLGKNSRIKWY